MLPLLHIALLVLFVILIYAIIGSFFMMDVVVDVLIGYSPNETRGLIDCCCSRECSKGREKGKQWRDFQKLHGIQLLDESFRNCLAGIRKVGQ